MSIAGVLIVFGIIYFLMGLAGRWYWSVMLLGIVMTIAGLTIAQTGL
jgi:hypothetical protein